MGNRYKVGPTPSPDVEVPGSGEGSSSRSVLLLALMRCAVERDVIPNRIPHTRDRLRNRDIARIFARFSFRFYSIRLKLF